MTNMSYFRSIDRKPLYIDASIYKWRPSAMQSVSFDSWCSKVMHQTLSGIFTYDVVWKENSVILEDGVFINYCSETPADRICFSPDLCFVAILEKNKKINDECVETPSLHIFNVKNPDAKMWLKVPAFRKGSFLGLTFGEVKNIKCFGIFWLPTTYKKLADLVVISPIGIEIFRFNNLQMSIDLHRRFSLTIYNAWWEASSGYVVVSSEGKTLIPFVLLSSNPRKLKSLELRLQDWQTIESSDVAVIKFYNDTYCIHMDVSNGRISLRCLSSSSKSTDITLDTGGPGLFSLMKIDELLVVNRLEQQRTYVFDLKIRNIFQFADVRHSVVEGSGDNTIPSSSNDPSAALLFPPFDLSYHQTQESSHALELSPTKNPSSMLTDETLSQKSNVTYANGSTNCESNLDFGSYIPNIYSKECSILGHSVIRCKVSPASSSGIQRLEDESDRRKTAEYGAECSLWVLAIDHDAFMRKLHNLGTERLVEAALRRRKCKEHLISTLCQFLINRLSLLEWSRIASVLCNQYKLVLIRNHFNNINASPNDSEANASNDTYAPPSFLTDAEVTQLVFVAVFANTQQQSFTSDWKMFEYVCQRNAQKNVVESILNSNQETRQTDDSIMVSLSFAEYLLNCMIEFLRCMMACELPPNEALCLATVDLCVFCNKPHLLQQLLQHKVLIDSKDLMVKLYTLSIQIPATYKWAELFAADLAKRLKQWDVVIRILLRRQKYRGIIPFLRSNNAISYPLRDFLSHVAEDVDLQHRDPELLMHILSSIRQWIRAAEISQSGGQCGMPNLKMCEVWFPQLHQKQPLQEPVSPSL